MGDIYYIVTYTRTSGMMRQTVGIACESNMIQLYAHLNKPCDCIMGHIDPWIVADIEPVDAID